MWTEDQVDWDENDGDTVAEENELLRGRIEDGKGAGEGVADDVVVRGGDKGGKPTSPVGRG